MTPNSENPKDVHDLFKTLSNINSSADLICFLQDILTPQEVEELALRWQIVKALDCGTPQRQIALLFKCSVTTVSRGSRQLKYGYGGFEKSLQKLRKP